MSSKYWRCRFALDFDFFLFEIKITHDLCDYVILLMVQCRFYSDEFPTTCIIVHLLQCFV